MDLIPLLVTGHLPIRIQIIAIGASVMLLIGIIDLIRQNRLKEGYSIIWFFISITVVVFSIFSAILNWFSQLVGISYAPAALFLLLLGGLFLLSLHFSVLVSRYDRRIRELAQEQALLKAELLQQKKK